MSEEQVTEDAVVSPESNKESLDLFSMSDEEINQMIAPPSFTTQNEQKDDEQNVQEEETEEEPAEESSETDEEVTDEEQEEETVEAATEDSTDAYDSSVEDTTTNENLNYKALYEEALAPLRANGKDFKFNDIKELRRLAQQGIGFNANMRAFKPKKKFIKMLENENLLSEDKLNYLIDLSKHNPDAINKLIKDSKINPLDLDVTDKKEYRPNVYSATDSQLELDEALANIEQSPTYQQTIDIVGNKWDESSRRKIVENPSYINDIDVHMQSGIFQQVSDQVERERMLGNLPIGINDLDAYNLVGARMNAAGAFNKPKAPTSKVTTKDTKRNSRRKAATSSGTKGKKQTPTANIDIFALSDEEFEKIMPKYL